MNTCSNCNNWVTGSPKGTCTESPPVPQVNKYRTGFDADKEKQIFDEQVDCVQPQTNPDDTCSKWTVIV